MPPGLRGLPPLGLVAAVAAAGGGSSEMLEALGSEVLAVSDVLAIAIGTAI